jgi:hypothetical protein
MTWGLRWQTTDSFGSKSKCGRVRDGCVIFNTVGTDHGGGPRDYRGRADLFGVRCSEVGVLFLVPVVIAPRSSMGLRLAPAKNNERSRIHFAADYEIARWTVERLLAVVEASAALPQWPTFGVGGVARPRCTLEAL